MSEQKRGGPLQGLRVVELTKVWAGPYMGKLLAFLGAEVIRVESLESLDVTRVYGVADLNQAPGFMAVNPQKLSVQIDMKKPEGVQLILDLLAKSDIVVENLRPGAVKRLGLGYEAVRAINPDIVYVSMAMYGNEGPLAYQTGYAPCFAALGGVSMLVGEPGAAPEGMNVRYADSSFGAAAAYAALVALLHRRRGGGGQYVDVSAVECMSSMIGDALMAYTLAGQLQQAEGTRVPDMAPHGVYPCRDGEWIAIAVSSDLAWQALAQMMAQPALGADAQLATLAGRKAREDALDAALAQWTTQHNAAELAALLQARGIAAAKSQASVDLIADAQFWERGFFVEVQDRQGHSRSALGPAWKMTDAAELRDSAPRLGEHNAYVLGTLLGLPESRQQALSEAGVSR